MALGLFNISYHSKVLPYEDEKTPIDLCQKKMLPIMTWEDGSSQNESLDIIKRLDSNNTLKWDLLTTEQKELEELLSELGSSIHSLCMPYWIYTKEFSSESRNYFQTKKEVKKGPFRDLVKNKDSYLTNLESTLSKIEKMLTPFYKSDSLTILDLMLASHLWGMYIYPEFQFNEKIHSYLQEIKKQTRFDYHQDLW
jgi:glutaredoxin 2